MTSYTNVIQEGLGDIIGDNIGIEQTEQPAKYETVYASAESPVFTYIAGGARPLITDYSQVKANGRHLCLIVKKDGNAAILETEGE